MIDRKAIERCLKEIGFHIWLSFMIDRETIKRHLSIFEEEINGLKKKGMN